MGTGAGLALALIYAGGYVGERAVSVWGKSIKMPTLAGMLLAGLALRNVPGPWRNLLAVPPRDWLSALRTAATVCCCCKRHEQETQTSSVWKFLYLLFVRRRLCPCV